MGLLGALGPGTARLAAGILAAGLAAAPALSAREGPAPARPGPRAASRERAFMPACTLLATRDALNDLIEIDQVLSNEVAYLFSDSRYLHDSWSGYSAEGLRDDWDPYSREGISARTSYEDQRTEIWNLYVAVKKLSDEMDAASATARRLEKRWWAIRGRIKKEVARTGSGDKSAARLASLKEDLAALASRLNGVNAKVPGLQRTLDYTRSYFVQYINSLAPDVIDPDLVVDVPAPWHWVYRDSGTPRPDLSYDFEKSYQGYLDAGHVKLHTRGGEKAMNEIRGCPNVLVAGLPAVVFLAAALGGCASESVIYRPASQLLPAHIRRIAVRNIVNRTDQVGIEDKLVLGIRDEFLRSGEYQIVPESSADGVVVVTVRRYIRVPMEWDSVLAPTSYKLRVLVDLEFVDRAANRILWIEPNIEGILYYRRETENGGITEEEARERIWDDLARGIVRRTIEGFGTVTGTSRREISGQAPPDQPPPALPGKPVNPDVY